MFRCLSRGLLQLAVACCLLLLALPATAQWVEGHGNAVVHDHDRDINKVEQQARNAALRNAAMQFESRVESHQTVTNGVITDTRMTVLSRARVQEVRNEVVSRHGDRIRVTLEARLATDNDTEDEAMVACGGEPINRFGKGVAFAGFHVVNPGQGGIGRLEGLDRAVPEALVANMQGAKLVRPFAATHLAVYEDARNAPTRMVERNRLEQAVSTASEMGVQFVVSGVVRDFGVEAPDTWRSSVLNNLRRGVGGLNRERRFVVDMMIHDGFSGAPILQQRFSTSGTWDKGPGDNVGFATAAFDQTPYGRQVNRLLAIMTQEIERNLACQPFMARIERVENDRVRIAAGANNGLRPGDTLALYRTERFLELPGQLPELQNSRANLTVRQVHPDFASGEMGVEGGRINIQRG
ncbi:MAG: hypothetical protein EA349_01250, partial [Halomonadaceae bacterium]